MTRHRLLRVVLLLALLAACPAAAPAQPARPPSRAVAELLERGLRHYERQQYDDARRDLEAAFALEPRPEVLYALGQTWRMLGDCRRATRYYQLYLEVSPTGKRALAARLNVERCRPALQQSPRPEAAAPPASAPALTAPMPPPRPGPPARGPWTRDWIGHGLAATGLAALGAGLGVWLSGRADAAQARRSSRYDVFLDRTDAARTKQIVAVSLGASGGALLVGGVLHYLLRPRRGGEGAPRITAGVAPHGMALGVSGRF
jgi:tetratricopeptide (TPR) repeat protein